MTFFVVGGATQVGVELKFRSETRTRRVIDEQRTHGKAQVAGWYLTGKHGIVREG